MKSLSSACLYGILDLGYVREEEVLRSTESLLRGGVDVLQLRAKGKPKARVVEWAAKIHELTLSAEVPLILNDYPDVLREIAAEGAHIGQDDGTVLEAREMAGRDCIIGKSTHSYEQAVAAEQEGADYIGFGPLFATPTKPGRPAIGLRDVREVNETVDIPVFCIGGIKRENLPEVVAAGAKRVVVVSGWLQADDIAAAVQRTREELS